MRGVWRWLLLAQVVSAITGPRIENDFDRRRQTQLGGPPGFNEHQTRFGLSSPLQTFQPQPTLVSSPTPASLQFPQQVFSQHQLQQSYVPQFNTILPTQNIPNVQLQNLPLQNNAFQYSQQANVNPTVLQNSFTPPQTLRQIPQTQSIIPQQNPTLPTYQNIQIPQNHQPVFQNPTPTVNIGQQRPTQAAFLPTSEPQQQQQIFNSPPNAITIQPAPNLGPQNFNLQNHNQHHQINSQVNAQNNLNSQIHHNHVNAQSNLNSHINHNAQNNQNSQINHNAQINQNGQINQNAQVPFQSNLGQAAVQSSNHNAQIQEYFEQSKDNIEKIKELQERARIIQKHQEFVQKQQQKQQEKVEKLHEEFISKQATKSVPLYSTTESYDDYYRERPLEKRRPIQPREKDLFRKAVELFEKEHPTTTTTTTTTTTPEPTTSRYRSRGRPKARQPPQDKNKQKLYNEIKSLLEESDSKGFDDSLRAKSAELLQKPDILKQLKVALAENSEDFNEKNYSSREISLNGQKFEVIRTNNPNLIPKGAITAESSNLAQIMAQVQAQDQLQSSGISFSDLTKGVLPPGANFELVKQTENGKLEEVKTPNEIGNKKKVTFVFLEEQDDGSFKVKGVKANGQQTEEGPEVENILNKIKKGEIQLPGPAKISNGIFSSTTASPVTEVNDYEGASSQVPPHSFSNYVTSASHGSSGHTNPLFNYQSTASPTHNTIRTKQTHSPTYSPQYNSVSTTERNTFKSSTPIPYDFSTNRNVIRQELRSSQFPSSTPFPSSTFVTSTPYNRQQESTYRPDVTYRQQDAKDLVVIGSSTAPSIETGNFQSRQSSPGLVDILKENGLFATAKYLKQSGLDTILNETGPYTIFAPTDKAFRTLLVQLGGPDRAEEKFRDNPRLLSGLLLHHVIPGAFDIGSLQDEMTGVSLAGTQLRVNQYDMHDVEWNEVRVTTINGARVLEDKKDIHIPQGIAHAVDRVMFPLPVGDLVQTLQADRDRRFTTFLKAVHASGFESTLAESKTYTVFAPTDAAFARLPPVELSKYSEKAAARALVARHVLPGTLYSAGMRYYQLKNSMEDAKPLTLQKSSGRIKVNNAQVVTHNIPATNGVIHAVDTLL